LRSHVLESEKFELLKKICIDRDFFQRFFTLSPQTLNRSPVSPAPVQGLSVGFEIIDVLISRLQGGTV
jgi:hypothetical protein